MSWFEFKSGTFWLFYLYPCLCGESRLLVLWCAGDRYDMVGSNEDRGRCRRPVARTKDDQTQVGYSVVARSIGRVTLCVIYTVHKEMRSAGFLVEPRNHGLRFVSGLASKPLGWVYWFGLKTKVDSWSGVWPQNH
jgi:hypothetical protein